jgi:hypothetical protein
MKLQGLFLFSFLMVLLIPGVNAQDVQYNSVGIKVAPITGTPLTMRQGWGNYVTFRRTQNNATWNIHNGQLGNNLEFFFTNAGGVSSFSSFVLQDDQKIRIGAVNTPGNYRLYVEGGILTEQVKVALKNSAGWADYVFAQDYHLPTLADVKSYIQTHKHLPKVPSAETLAAEQGFELGKMTVIQQEKIEELFLYVIQLDEKLKKLENENAELRKMIENLKN